MSKLGEIKKGKELEKKELYKKFVFVECPICHNKRWSRDIPFHRHRYPYIRCWACLTKEGPTHAIWKGGRYFIRGYYRIRLFKDDPYFLMADTNKYVFEHRYIMARHLGRILEGWELVHHKNGDKGDNRIENLELISHLQNISASVRDTIAQQTTRIKLLEARVTLLEAENIALKEAYLPRVQEV